MEAREGGEEDRREEWLGRGRGVLSGEGAEGRSIGESVHKGEVGRFVLGGSQVICPFIFDQHFWAERMEWMGLAPPPLQAHRVFPAAAADHRTSPAAEAHVQPAGEGRPEDALIRAILQASTADVRREVARVGDELRCENGLLNATVALRRALQEAHPPACLRQQQPPKRHCEHLEQPGDHDGADATHGGACGLRNKGAADAPLIQLASGLRLHCVSPVETHHIHREIFQDDVYFQHGIRLSRGDSVVDVGANIGLFTLRVAFAAADANIWALEPVPPIFHTLQRNMDLHRQPGVKVRTLMAAAGAESTSMEVEGGVEVTFFPHMAGNSTLYPAEKRALQGKAMKPHFFSQSESFRCRVVTISQLMRTEGIKSIELLKVDVEGAELQVLQGVEDGDWARIKQLVVEVHDVNGRLADVVGLLQEKGYCLAVDAAPDCPDGTFLVYATSAV
ncbi:hypothetical protein CYMTET_30475 [Cymbomonas tetramitiformis]|uniref:Methyltransferase FkbM domain-containing protein n=1 Tax=Cymbomonas tetramitiformis TaxID=36881 RepID=A0AAE0FIX2_9CHLO|nr:hypothetical protein CYMTET_30475 [Cymbomonas tetramitiformis]